MANSYFVVHNGLTVGPLSIDATTGDISTPGNVNLSGNIGVSAIRSGDSSVAVTDLGTNSVINFNVDGNTAANITTAGAWFAGNVYAASINTVGGGSANISGVNGLSAVTISASGFINSSGNILGRGGIFNGLTVNGNESITGYLNVTGNILGATATFSALNVAGAAVASVDDATALAIALGG